MTVAWVFIYPSVWDCFSSLSHNVSKCACDLFQVKEILTQFFSRVYYFKPIFFSWVCLQFWFSFKCANWLRKVQSTTRYGCDWVWSTIYQFNYIQFTHTKEIYTWNSDNWIWKHSDNSTYNKLYTVISAALAPEWNTIDYKYRVWL